MKRKVKQGGLYSYLEQSGILTNGTDEQIKSVKRQYWALYKASWRKKSRQANKEIRIQLTENDLRVITSAAKKYKRSKARYIKEAALAYLHRQFLVPDVLLVGEIRQLLTMNYTLLQQLKDTDSIPYQKQAILLKEFEAIEQQILSVLHHPVSLENEVAAVIKNNPEYKNILRKLLQT